jgi:hypothetical protein
VEERLRSDTGASLDHDYVCPNNVLLQALERRADKQISRQEGSLVRAVLRVWKAHERGHLLERVQHARVLREAWETWKRRLRRQGDLEGSLPLFHRLVLFMLVISYRARLCSAFPSPCHFFRTPSLAKSPRHATRGARLCSAICQRAAAVPRSLQVACTVTCAREAFPSGQDRR